ncbi:MAG: amidohydrolase [Eubacteriales bacterium]|nr:amidohydrolase [Eubacteriales bacterium]MDD3073945.1 amidohydrolase [Eubacteriales bacterium]MDD4079413.1 amidohydrolase [Eubacteriales bacterium]MDD4769321.1 amidohydrolase [Eubacteriales bacterium]
MSAKKILAIINADIHTIAHREPIKGSILVENGKIAAIGQIEIPEEASTIDAAGASVYPGFIDPHTHLGVSEQGMGWEGRDYNEITDPVTSQLRALDAINPQEDGYREAVEAGITTVMSTPGSANILGGSTVVLKTGGGLLHQRVIRENAGIKAAFGENPKRVYSGQKRMPSTRMGSAAVLREALVAAQNYLHKIERAGDDAEKMPPRDLKNEALIPVLKKEIPLRMHAHRADDIATAIRIAQEFDIDMTLEHASEAHLIVDRVKESGFPAIVGPSMGTPGKIETQNKTLESVKILSEAGITVALTTDHPVLDIYQLLHAAAAVVRETGMDDYQVLRLITINAAKILGVEDRVGSIEAGKDADLVIIEGHPFDYLSTVMYTIIDGEVVYPPEL